MDKKTGGLKELGSIKPKFLKIYLLFFIFTSGISVLGFFGRQDLFDIISLPLFIIALLGLLKKKKWSTGLIAAIAGLGITVCIFTQLYIGIPFYALLFWLGATAYKQDRENLSASENKKRRYHFLKGTIQILLIVLVLFALIYMFIAKPFHLNDESMEPTLKKRSDILVLLLPPFINPGRQDIVVNTNAVAKISISRIIGIAGDRIVFRDGYLFLNGELLNEPYTSTWINSNAFLGQNCQEIIVPKGNYFIIGDNREASEYGFMPRYRITGYIPHSLIRFFRYNPIDWNSHLRDTSHDKDLLGKSFLNTNLYVELLNIKRKENGLSPIILEDKANKAANFLLKDMIAKKYYTYEKSKADPALLDAFSRYNITSKGMVSVGLGFYGAQNTLDFALSSNDWKKILLSPDYSTMGIATTVTNINNCPQQLNVTLYFEKSTTFSQVIQPPSPITNAGFLSGQNNKADIKTLQDYLNSEQQSKNSWQNVNGSGSYSQQDLNKLLDEQTRIISFTQTIIDNLQNEKGSVADNISLWNAVLKMSDEATNLANKLNGQ